MRHTIDASLADSPIRRFADSVHRRGSALSLAIIVSVVITGLVIVMAWVAGVQAQNTANLSKLDQAFFAAESGVHRVAWYCKNGQMASLTQPLTGTANGYNYSTTWTVVSGNSIRVTSTGFLGNVSTTISETVTPPGTAIAAFASAGDFDNKNVLISGDVMTGGNYTNTGSGTLTGNLTYAGSATNTGMVTGTLTKTPFTPVDFAKLDTVLRANAVTQPPGTGLTYDFTAMSGSNKVIYINGSVTDPVVKGAGTLYVNGIIHYTKANAIVGAIGSPVNLVATSDIDFDKTINLYGTLYTPTNWNRAQVSIVGLVYIGGVSYSNSGTSTFTLSANGVPWFDTRSSGNPTLTFTNFTGPLP